MPTSSMAQAPAPADGELRRLTRAARWPFQLACCWLLASDPAAASPTVTLHRNTNNVAGAPWRSSSSSVKYLGLYNSSAECEWACLR